MIPPEPPVLEDTDDQIAITSVPHNSDMERALVGAALQSLVMFRTASEIISDGDFYIHRNQFVWKAIAALAENDIQPDMILIHDITSKSQWTSVDFPYLARCIEHARDCIDIETVQEYARRIREFSLRREMLKMANAIATGAYDLQKPVETFISESLMSMQGMSEKRPGSVSVSARDAADRMFDYYEKVSKNPEEAGFLTKLTDFDKIVGGYFRGRSWIIGARPGKGKTSLIITTIVNMMSRPIKPHVVLNDMEMTIEAITARIVGMLVGIDTEKITRGILDDDERIRFNEGISEIQSWPLIIIDERDPARLMSVVSQLVAAGKCDILFNDYIGKFEAKAENRVRQVGIASAYMQKIAVRLNIAVVTAAQVSRTVDTRGKDAKLVLSDLKETGDLEQDADGVLFINPDPENSQIRICEIAKNRHGRCGEFALVYIGSLTQFKSAVVRKIDQNA